MRKIKHLLCLLVPLFIGTQCSTDEPVKTSRGSYEVPMKFQIEGVEETVIVKFIYDKSEKRYIPNSDSIGETKAVNKLNGEMMYVYYLKSENPNPLWGIYRGYYGYSGSTGCFFYGTLIVGDNGNSHFQADTGVDSILNPPQCGYWYA